MCEVSGAGRKTPSQCKMRWERILNPGVKRGLWTKEEDQKLKEVAAAMDYKWSHVSCQRQAFWGIAGSGRVYVRCDELDGGGGGVVVVVCPCPWACVGVLLLLCCAVLCCSVV